MTVRVNQLEGKKVGAMVAEVLVPVVDGRWSTPLDTTVLVPGSYGITVSGVDNVGNKKTSETTRITIENRGDGAV